MDFGVLRSALNGVSVSTGEDKQPSLTDAELAAKLATLRGQTPSTAGAKPQNVSCYWLLSTKKYVMFQYVIYDISLSLCLYHFDGRGKIGFHL